MSKRKLQEKDVQSRIPNKKQKKKKKSNLSKNQTTLIRSNGILGLSQFMVKQKTKLSSKFPLTPMLPIFSLSQVSDKNKKKLKEELKEDFLSNFNSSFESDKKNAGIPQKHIKVDIEASNVPITTEVQLAKKNELEMHPPELEKCEFCKDGEQGECDIISCDNCGRFGCHDNCISCFWYCLNDKRSNMYESEYLCMDCESKYQEEKKFCAVCRSINPYEDTFLGEKCIDTHCYGCFKSLHTDNELDQEYCKTCTASIPTLCKTLTNLFIDGIKLITNYLELPDYKKMEERDRKFREKGYIFCHNCKIWYCDSFCTQCALLCPRCTDFEEECSCNDDESEDSGENSFQ